MGQTIARVVNCEDKKRLPLDQITFCVTQYKSKWDPYKRDHWVLRWIRESLDRVIAKIRSHSWYYFTLEPAYTSGWIKPTDIRGLESAITEDDMKAFLLKMAVSHGINVQLLFIEDEEARLTKIVELGGEEQVVFDSREVSKRSKVKKSGKKKTNARRNPKKKDKGEQ